MWSAEAPRKSRREREASLSDPRDRKRKREKEEKREKDEKRDEKRDKKEDKDKHSKRDSHYDRDQKKSGDYVHKGYGDDRRQKEPQGQGTPRGRSDNDRGAAERTDRVGNKSDGRDDRKRDDTKEPLKGKEEKVDEIPPIEEAPAVQAAAKKDWREEMEGEEDERDLSDDEDALAKKLAESRKRREQMMAKKAKEKEEEPPAPTPTEAAVAVAAKFAAADDGDSGSDAGAVERKEGEGVSREQKAEVNKFLAQQRATKEAESQGGMFGETADKSLNTLTRGQSGAIGLTGASGEDWDDPDGYYIAEIGEVMGDDGEERYLVVENFSGKGVFSNVVKAKDQVDKGDGVVAIKIMRANDMMKKAAEKEIEILQILNNADKGNKRHVIRMIRTFYYRKHLCLVFEYMADDLRGALKKHTKGKGMALQAIRAYTKQLIIGLRHMHKCNIIHADIKPDNILINEGHNTVKFCDLGTALEIKDAAVTPYLVSRFYRAPEIILGCEYSTPVDVFALGATLFELFTGKILLNSKTNNDSLRKMMELKGKIPKNVIKKGMLWKTHFDDNLDFKHVDTDQYTKETVTRIITDLNAKKDIFDLLLDRVGREKNTSKEREDMQTIKRIKQFADLLNQMLAFDPEKRITANDALSHPFLEDRLGKGVEGGDNRGAGGPARR